MTIYGEDRSQTNWTWRNDLPELGQLVIAEMPMRVGDRYSLVPIYTDFPDAQKSFTGIIRRVDIIGTWILVLSELKPSEEKKNDISLSLKIPYRIIERETFLVKHYVITNGLLNKKNIHFGNVYPIKSEREYRPDKIVLPVAKPQIIYGYDENHDFIWMDAADQVQQNRWDWREKCVVV